MMHYHYHSPRCLPVPILILKLLSISLFQSHLSSASLIFFNDSNLAEIQYKLFDVPYANLRQDNGYIKGNVYYYTDISPCNDIFPRAPSANSTYTNGSSNGSLLLLNYVHNNTTCTVQQIALAKQAGYDAVLFCDENDRSTISITNTIQATGFPVVILQAKLAQTIKDSIVDDRTHYTVGLFGTIALGIATIISLCCCVYLTCFCACCGICCCCLCSCNNGEDMPTVQGNNVYRFGRTAQGNGNRNELTESINRRLQQMTDDINARIPYGSRQTHSIPIRTYVKEEEDDSCAICVDEFQNGEQIKKLPCNHIFHVKCIDEWLGKHSSLCPLCKYNLRSNGVAERTPLQSDNGASYGAV